MKDDDKRVALWPDIKVRLPREKYEFLKSVAEGERRSMGNQAAIVIEEWLDRRARRERVRQSA